MLNTWHGAAIHWHNKGYTWWGPSWGLTLVMLSSFQRTFWKQQQNIFAFSYDFSNIWMAQVVGNLLHRRKGSVKPDHSVPWLLMSWWHNMPSGNKPLPAPMLTETHNDIMSKTGNKIYIMAWCTTVISPLLTCCGYHCLALSHPYKLHN